MPTFKEVKCKTCRKRFYKDTGHINENLKLGHNFYCSKACESKSKNKQKLFTCEHPDCDNIFPRRPKDVSPQNFCSRKCAALVNSKITGQKRVKFKTCAVCKIEFRKEDGASRYKFCSVGCKNKSMIIYAPDELLKIIKTTARKIKRAPAKRELQEIAECCVGAFGSWNNAVMAAGLKPNRSHSQRMYKRLNTIARDGHVCDSISEAIVDNWFTRHGVQHIKNVPYPETNHRADWRMSDKVFVEYFGLAKDSPRYDRAIRKKRGLCRKYGIRLVEIHSNDLYPQIRLDEKLRDVLPSF